MLPAAPSAATATSEPSAMTGAVASSSSLPAGPPTEPPTAATLTAAPAALIRSDSASDFLAAAARASAGTPLATAAAAADLAAAAKERKARLLEHEAGAPGAAVPGSLEAFVNATSKLPASASPAAAQQHTVPVMGKTKVGAPTRRKDSFGKDDKKRGAKRPPAGPGGIGMSPGFMSETWPPPRPTSAAKGSGYGATSHRRRDGSRDGGASHRSSSPRHGSTSPRGASSPRSPRVEGAPPGVGRSKSLGAQASAGGEEGKGGTPEKASKDKSSGSASHREKGEGERSERKKSRKSKKDKEATASAAATELDRTSQDAQLPIFLRHLLMHQPIGYPPPPMTTEAWATCDLTDGFVPIAECLHAIHTDAALREVRRSTPPMSH